VKRWSAGIVAVVGVLLVSSPATGAAGDTGYDVSWPQCTGSAFTSVPPGTPVFGVVAVNHGAGRTTNECLQAEATWAAGLARTPMLYTNGADPGPANGNWPTSGRTSPATCVNAASSADTGCAYDYGWDLATDALTRADGQTAFTSTSVTWWIDVEVANSWVLDGLMDTASIQGMVDKLRSAGVPDVGVYGLATDWATITGSSTLGTTAYSRGTSNAYRSHWAFTPSYPIEDGPVWFAGAGTPSNAQTACAASSFTGGEKLLSQYRVMLSTTKWDGDYRCADADHTNPTATMTLPTALVTTTPTVVTGWSGTDAGSGVASFDLQTSKAAFNTGLGTWSLIGRRLLSSSASFTSPPRGSTACWSARARDAAGNLSAWSGSRCVATPLDDRDLSASTGWTRTIGASGWFQGSYTSSTRLSSTLTKTGVRTSHLVLIAYRCPTCGSVSVLVNGSVLRTVSLASSTSGRVQVALPRFSLRTATVALRVASSGKLVRIDGLATSSV